jgi:formiminoglutamase
MVVNDWLHVTRSDSALLMCFPHGGTELPAPFDAGLVSRDLALKDTDWHIRRLYDGLADATRIWTDVSRTVIDVNRDPSGASLYPGQATTELCPTTTFDGEPLYEADVVPDAAERRGYFDPYHAAIAAEIARLRGRHSEIVVFDCHSIRGVVSRLFEGELPEFNVGTDGGRTCAPELEAAVVAACAASGRSHVLNGRFRGGWTTRHYGNPGDGVHAVQLEIAQRAYLDEANPDEWRQDIADRLRPDLARILQACTDFAR